MDVDLDLILDSTRVRYEHHRYVEDGALRGETLCSPAFIRRHHLGAHLKARGGVTVARIVDRHGLVLAEGRATCAPDVVKRGKLIPGDAFVKAEGRRLALQRAARALGGAGLECITTARMDQIAVHGWSPAHDDAHDAGELVRAARAYLHLLAPHAVAVVTALWPWSPDGFHPSEDPVANLSKAGALIAAEIDRILRAKKRESGHSAKVSGVTPPDDERPVTKAAIDATPNPGIARQQAEVDAGRHGPRLVRFRDTLDRHERMMETLAQIRAIVDEPLDERRGYGPTRSEQFARIEEVLRRHDGAES